MIITSIFNILFWSFIIISTTWIAVDGFIDMTQGHFKVQRTLKRYSRIFVKGSAVTIIMLGILAIVTILVNFNTIVDYISAIVY